MAFVLVIAGLFFYATLPWVGPLWAGVVATVAIAGSAALLFRLPLSVVYWERGAAAERAAGSRLAGLEPDGFVVLSDREVPMAGGNVDHVVVGPTGVFLIETKTRTRGVEVVNGRLYIGDRHTPEVARQAAELAGRVQMAAAKLMSEYKMTVVPMVCFVGKKPSGDRVADGVVVVWERDLLDEIRTGARVLSDDQIQHLARRLNQALPRND